MGAEGGVVAGLEVEERENRACVIVSAELEDKLLLLVLLVMLSFLAFTILGPIPVPFPKLPFPTDPDPSDGEVPRPGLCPAGNGTGLDLALSYSSKYEDERVWYIVSRVARLERAPP
jgi:hypothetical protein